jgi:hypothetical protein
VWLSDQLSGVAAEIILAEIILAEISVVLKEGEVQVLSCS